MKVTIYIKVSVEDELPTICKEYFTNLGEVFFYPTDKPHFSKKVDWWLREAELELPDDSELKIISQHEIMFNADKREWWVDGIKYLREQLLKQLKIK